MPNTKLLVLAMAAAVSAGAQSTPWELGDPSAKLLMGIDLKSLRESSVGQSIREQLSAQAAPAGIQGPFQAMALGLLEQIDRVYLSSPANATAGAKTNPPYLLAVEGRLPMAQVKPFLQGTSRRYRTADIYRISQTDTTSLAMLEDGTLLMGDEKSVLAAIDRRGRVLPPPSVLLGRAQALASAHDFWMIADESLSKFQPANTVATNPLASQIAAKIKSMDMGLSLRDGFQLEVGLATESGEVAAQMAQLLSAQIQAAMQAQPSRPETAELAHKLQIAAEGNRMRMSLALSKDEFEQQLRAVQAARAVAAANPQPAARQAKPATPGKITIYGLEGGPRVIETTPGRAR